jgi:hypothetical protein
MLMIVSFSFRSLSSFDWLVNMRQRREESVFITASKTRHSHHIDNIPLRQRPTRTETKLHIFSYFYFRSLHIFSSSSPSIQHAGSCISQAFTGIRSSRARREEETRRNETIATFIAHLLLDRFQHERQSNISFETAATADIFFVAQLEIIVSVQEALFAHCPVIDGDSQ